MENHLQGQLYHHYPHLHGQTNEPQPSGSENVYPKKEIPLFSKLVSSHHLRTGRILLYVLLGALLLTLYLSSSNCWPAMGSLFSNDHRRQVVSDIGSATGSRVAGPAGQTCFFGSSSSSFGGEAKKKDIRPARRRGSLLAYPLQVSQQSLSLTRLTVGKVQELFRNYSVSSKTGNCTSWPFWKLHRRESVHDRLYRLEQGCSRYDFTGRIFAIRSSSTNKHRYSAEEDEEDGTGVSSLEAKTNPVVRSCTTRNCPILVDQPHQVLACFVQKVASTSLKSIFLRLLDSKNSESSVAPSSSKSTSNLTTFHLTANEALLRVSPLYVTHSKEVAFYKALFVRHPFVRLVSAFKDKAERGPVAEPFFYEMYFTPLLRRLYGNDSSLEDRRPTFAEFVDDMLLLEVDPRKYDEHWAPIWTRCEPCYLKYDFVGKLENSRADFAAFKGHLATSDKEEGVLVNTTIWANYNERFNAKVADLSSDETVCRSEHFKYEETVRYLATLRPKSLVELYRKYYLDFELFGYTFEELFT